MRIVLLVPILVSIVLFGCSGDPYEQYIGHWERKGVEHPAILQITKDGDSYLMNDNILQEKDMLGRSKKAIVLKKSEGQLSVENGFGSVMLGISEDGKTLRVSNQEFSRISDQEVSAIKEMAAKEKAEFEKNKSLCEAITREYQDAVNSINKENLGLQERTAKRAALKDATIEKAKSVPKCNPGFFW